MNSTLTIVASQLISVITWTNQAQRCTVPGSCPGEFTAWKAQAGEGERKRGIRQRISNVVEVWPSRILGERLFRVRCDCSGCTFNSSHLLKLNKKTTTTTKNPPKPHKNKKQEATPLKETEQRSSYSARKRTTQNSFLENHDKRTKTGLDLPSSAEIAIAVIKKMFKSYNAEHWEYQWRKKRQSNNFFLTKG